MNDPYKVLGVSPDASDDEIKKTYRELVRKYHPDSYHDNPLSDLAQEKMKEVNEAYNSILSMRSGGGNQPGRGKSGSSGGSVQGAKVRAAVNSGDLKLAEELLNAFPEKNAEWYFLMGSVCYRKGWLDDAMRYYQTAANMDPTNTEYRQALAFMRQGGQAYYRPYGQPQSSGQGCDACDCCFALMCMNMCCRSW